MKDVPVIVLSDEESVLLKINKKILHMILRLLKNSTFFNNIEVHIVSFDDENVLHMANKKKIEEETEKEESDEAFSIRFKRSENRKRPYIPKIPTMTHIDESMDDDVANPNDVKDQFDILLDDEVDDDIYEGEELVHETTNEVLHSDESDDRFNEYDFSNTFIDDGPLDDEPS
nr:pyrophosphatase [Tanacetum cinerariifolium]